MAEEGIVTTGYQSAQYAHSLGEYGEPIHLPAADGWVLKRAIPGTSFADAMGCYPLFCCVHWDALADEMAALEQDCVSLAVVTDPFGDYQPADLQRAFPDVMRPFKRHYVVDLEQSAEQLATKRTRKHVARAQREVEVEVCPSAEDFLNDWMTLYDALIQRHAITGIRAFSRDSFAQQLRVPGVTAIRAIHNGTCIGAQICYLQGDVVQCHLAAYSETGYALNAAYALEWFSMRWFADKAKWYNLGGGAGSYDDDSDGLSQYKQRWASETRTSYFCGRILQPERYAAILAERNLQQGAYFPAYRKGEYTQRETLKEGQSS